MKDLDKCYRLTATLASKISNRELIEDNSIPCEVTPNCDTYEELMIWC